MTDKEMIAALTRQLEVTTVFLQLEARRFRESGEPEKAEPTEKQIASNLALVSRSRSFHYADAVAAR